MALTVPVRRRFLRWKETTALQYGKLLAVPNQPFQMIRVAEKCRQGVFLAYRRKTIKQTVLPCSKDLARYRTEADDFLRPIVTCDETCVYHDIPESKQTSVEWQKPGESASRKAETRLLLEKFLQRFLTL